MDIQDSIAVTLDYLPSVLSVMLAVFTIFGAIRSGVLKSLGGGNLKDEVEVDPKTLERIRDEIKSGKSTDPIPFEIEQLAKYYALTFDQARIGFWFSLVSASAGFVVIVAAAVLYKGTEIGPASIKIISGLVVDAVSALFFVQSKRAQQSMSAFFEKLRNDRQLAEARRMCEEIEDVKVRDNLKTMLVLHYSGLDASPMMPVLSGERKVGRKEADKPAASNGISQPGS